MTARNRRDPFLGFSFLVEFDGLVVGGFTEVTGLQLETVVETYREGGWNDYEHKLAGPARYPANLILKHGLTDADVLWRWCQDVSQGRITRKNGTVYLLDSRGQPAVWWTIAEAYPVKWAGPDLRADSNTVALESIEFVHHGISRSV